MSNKTTQKSKKYTQKTTKVKAVVSKKPIQKSAVKTPSKAINCQLPGAELLAEGKSVKQVMATLEKEMKPEHDRFCREYIIDDNATRAYMRSYPNAGYGTANVEGCRLLAKPSVRSKVEQLRAERNKRLEISADKVLRRLEARASVTPRDLYDSDGTFIPIHEMHPDVAIGIKSVEVAELYAGSGDERTAIGLVRKITMNDGKASDELLGKNLGLWKEVGSAANPLTVKHFEVVFGREDD